ncbi:hypothetical protein HELRODRAFT_127531, partial [Helobdella robusta]|uniref:WH1 domain-containing protein n=1 Tax=Helobdella robusta TaxID=6412 RepID=T1EHE9_HELRO
EDNVLSINAQIMIRDASKGGWVPRGCGGISTIFFCKVLKVVSEKHLVEFYIRCVRDSDKKTILNSEIKRDFSYTIANPTFYHWECEDGGKFGLTFQSSKVAKLFEKNVKKIIDALKHG